MRLVRKDTSLHQVFVILRVFLVPALSVFVWEESGMSLRIDDFRFGRQREDEEARRMERNRYQEFSLCTFRNAHWISSFLSAAEAGQFIDLIVETRCLPPIALVKQGRRADCYNKEQV
jgi:hypothetical protein